MLYQANWLTFIKGNEAMLNKLVARVDKEVNHFKDDISKHFVSRSFYREKNSLLIDLDGNDTAGNYLTAVFFKGVLLKNLNKFSEAKDAFNTVLK